MLRVTKYTASIENKERSPAGRIKKECLSTDEVDDFSTENIGTIEKVISKKKIVECNDSNDNNNNNDDNSNNKNNDDDKFTDMNVLVSGRVLYSFIRKRSQGGFHAYGLTTVKVLKNGQKVEVRN